MAVESSKAKQSTVVCCSVQLSAVSCFGAACQSIQICHLKLVIGAVEIMFSCVCENSFLFPLRFLRLCCQVGDPFSF